MTLSANKTLAVVASAVCLGLLLAAAGGVASTQQTYNSTVTVAVGGGGDAEVSVQNTFTLSGRETEAFDNRSNEVEQRVQSDVMNRFRAYLELLEGEGVSRNISLSNPSITTERNGDNAVVTVSFTWSNFARQSNGKLVVDRVFSPGFSLREGQQLMIEGSGEASVTGSGEVEGNTVVWRGPTEVEDTNVSFSGGSGLGLPGFTVLGGLITLVFLALAGLRRRPRSS